MRRRKKLTDEDLAALYRDHSEGLLRFFRRRVSDPQTALDLVGETFARALKGRNQFRGKTLEDARSWLFGIARLLVLDYYKKGKVERRAMERLKMERVEIADDPHGEAFESTSREEVLELLGRIKPEYQDAVSRRMISGQSYSSIAESLGVSEDVVRARVSRGLKQLRKAADDMPVNQEDWIPGG